MTVVHGDQDLVDRLRAKLGRRHSAAACGVVSPDGRRVASIGTTADGTFEIGSISKGVTGLLYVDAVDRGEVRPDTVLGDLFPLGDTAAARITLGSLATHRSGLPRLAAFPERFGKTRVTWSFARHGTNPYDEDVETLVARARLTSVGMPRPRYSNVGFELLGHAVATAAGMPYADLVRTRLAEPLGLRTLSVPATPAELGADAVRGGSRTGRAKDPWLGEGIGPAGGIRASVSDMTALMAALLAGTAPGIRALDPVAPFRGGMHVGAAWMTFDVKGRAVTWHNGGTGGFRSWLGLDRAAGTGAVVLSAVGGKAVDMVGLRLLMPDRA